MKRICLLFSVFTMFVCLSCSSDDDGNADGSLDITQANLVGKWSLKDGTWTDPETGEIREHYLMNTRSSIVMYENWTCIYGGNKGMYNLSGNKLSFETSYTQFGNTINVKQEHIVKKVTKTTLIMENGTPNHILYYERSSENN